MRILDRASTLTYFPDVKSYLHIPAQDGLRDSVLHWLQEDPVARALVEANTEPAKILRKALPFFPDLDVEALTAHVRYLTTPPESTTNDGREGEFAALTSGRRGVHTSDGPPILDAEVMPVGDYDPQYVSSRAPITGVVAVHRLAETRVLAGFTRIHPPARRGKAKNGYRRLWGSEPAFSDPARADRDWLPGLRLYGEGILLILNEDRVKSWCSRNGSSIKDKFLNEETLTARFQLAHTLAHLVMNAAAVECGYPTAALRDRIYAYGPETAVLIHAGEGDALGTMGGLVELAQPGLLEQLLRSAYATANWCPLDPVCLSPGSDPLHSITPGACHHCCLLPETSCEWWNEGLDRATLIGRGPISGFLTG